MKNKIMVSLTAILITLTVILVCPLQMLNLNVSAITIYNDGYYTYTVKDGEATITKCDASIKGDITLPETLGEAHYPVTKIGEYAFSSCQLLTSVVMPNGIKVIDYAAFHNCTSLTSVTIPKSITNIGPSVFASCKLFENVYITDMAAWCNIVFSKETSNPLYHAKNLYLNNELVTDLVIPEGVTTIKKNVFYNCNAFTSITIPKSIESIGKDAFYGCSSLEKLNITDLTAWCNIDFANEYSNPMSCGVELYSNGKLITDLIIPSGVTTIKKYAFSNGKFNSAVMPEGVKDIGDYAFLSCLKMRSVTIPKSFTKIGKDAFYFCYTLDRVFISDISAWCNVSFDNLYSNPLINDGELYLNGEIIRNLVVPNGVTKIGSYTFYYCSSIKSVSIPDSLTEIGYRAFYGCVSLERVDITDIEAWYKISFDGTDSDPMNYAGNLYLNNQLVTELRVPESQNISSNRYYNYKCIEDVFISKTLTKIEIGAFSNCSNIKNVYFEGSSEEWAKVELHEYNDYIKKANIYYNCTDVPVGVVSVDVTKLPEKLEYVQNRGGLDLTGGILMVYYGGGAIGELKLTSLAADIQGFDINIIGSQILTVSFEGYTEKFTVCVFKNGDLNGDGGLNAKDLTIVRTSLFDNSKTTERYDINEDNAFNVKDLVHLKKKIAGIID